MKKKFVIAFLFSIQVGMLISQPAVINQFDSSNKKHGNWIEEYTYENYNETDSTFTLKWVGKYNKGQHYGTWRGYLKGTDQLVREFMYYSFSPEDSAIINYYENGNIESIQTNSINNVESTTLKYSPNGGLIQTTISNNDSIYLLKLNDNGIDTVKYRVYYKDTKESIEIEYYLNGNKRSCKRYRDEEEYGISKTYHINDQLKEVYEIQNGRLNGVLRTYYDSGILKSSISFNGGYEEGPALYYDKFGKLVKEVFN